MSKKINMWMVGIFITSIFSFNTRHAEEDLGLMAKYVGMDEFESGSRNYKGYNVEVCRYFQNPIDFCTDKNLNKIISTANNSKKTLYQGKYNVITLDSPNRKEMGFVLIDTKGKKILPSPYISPAKTKVTYNKDLIYVHGDINSIEYSGTSGSEEDPAKLKLERGSSRKGDYYFIIQNEW